MRTKFCRFSEHVIEDLICCFRDLTLPKNLKVCRTSHIFRGSDLFLWWRKLTISCCTITYRTFKYWFSNRERFCYLLFTLPLILTSILNTHLPSRWTRKRCTFVKSRKDWCENCGLSVVNLEGCELHSLKWDAVKDML